MGISAAIAMGVSAAAATYSTLEARKARKDAERQAALERDALADLQQEPEPVIPLADDITVKQTRRRSIASQMRRRGRSSTILTDTGAADVLGT